MEEHDQEADQVQVDGFNNGYLLAKHEPELAALLTAHKNPNSPYFTALVNGKEEYDREVLEWTKKFQRDAPSRDDRHLGRER